MEYIAFDAHKRYTLASAARSDGGLVREQRIPHERGALQQFLERCEHGSPVAVETIGNWYWIVDEIEAAGCVPKLVHAREGELMMGEINKTDKLDARGLNRLQRAGTLPRVWIPPGELRDQRDLPRTRMVLVRQRTQLKNRIHATLAKYALHDVEASDLFGVRGRALLRQRLDVLPPHTAYATQQLLEQVDGLDRPVRGFEQRKGAPGRLSSEAAREVLGHVRIAAPLDDAGHPVAEPGSNACQGRGVTLILHRLMEERRDRLIFAPAVLEVQGSRPRGGAIRRDPGAFARWSSVARKTA
jgi:transposase